MLVKKKKKSTKCKAKDKNCQCQFFKKKPPMPTLIVRNNKVAFVEGHSCTQQIKSHQQN